MVTPTDDFSEREKAELNVLLQEWVALRAEILGRLSAQLLIIAAGTALASALLTAALTSGVARYKYALILCIPVVSGIAAALHLLQDAAIIPIAKYLHGVVGERIRRLFPENPDLFQWEGFLSQWRSGAGKGVVVIGAPAGLAVALFPGFAALLGVGFGVASSAELRSALDIVHALLASVGAGFLIADVIYRLRIAQHYRKVAPA